MKKITPLAIILFFCLQGIFAQTLTHSTSQTILDGNSRACETNVGTPVNPIFVTNENTYYRSFKLSDFSISSAYNITSVEYAIEKMVNAPAGGYPVKVSVYTSDTDFPTGTLTLISEVTEMITNQTLTLHSTPITAAIPSNSEIVIGVSVASAVGSGNNVAFQIGSNKDGENKPSYLKAPICGYTAPNTFASGGFADVHIVMNVKGNSATAGNGDLDLVSFNYYPNPVKDRLNMTAQEEISSVSVYNILGQEIKTVKPSKLQASLDLTSLSTGTYMVRAKVNDKIGSFKVVKE